MKKIIIIGFCAMLIAGLFLGCAPVPMQEGTIINGNEATITLVENGTTGYGWVYSVSDPAIIQMIKDESVAGAQEGVMGASGFHVFTFKGLSEGEAKIVFEYVRAWEQNVPPAETRIATVKVDSNKNIIEIK